MSFVESENDVMYPVEGLIKAIFKQAIGLDLGEGHFRQMTYKEAMRRYGSDKPDTRFGLELTTFRTSPRNATLRCLK